jgi:hypothetical protein
MPFVAVGAIEPFPLIKNPAAWNQLPVARCRLQMDCQAPVAGCQVSKSMIKQRLKMVAISYHCARHPALDSRPKLLTQPELPHPETGNKIIPKPKLLT